MSTWWRFYLYLWIPELVCVQANRGVGVGGAYVMVLFVSVNAWACACPSWLSGCVCQAGSTAAASSTMRWSRPTFLPLATTPSSWCAAPHPWSTLPVSPTWTSWTTPLLSDLHTETHAPGWLSHVHTETHALSDLHTWPTLDSLKGMLQCVSCLPRWLWGLLLFVLNASVCWLIVCFLFVCFCLSVVPYYHYLLLLFSSFSKRYFFNIWHHFFVS